MIQCQKWLTSKAHSSIFAFALAVERCSTRKVRNASASPLAGIPHTHLRSPSLQSKFKRFARLFGLKGKRYWEKVSMKERGACGAVAQVLYSHGWGRIASCWLSYTGNGKPPDQRDAMDWEESSDEWYFHWVNINKFSGVIDVVGLPGHELCSPILTDLRVIDKIKEEMVDIVEDNGYGRHRVRPRWPRKDLQFWEEALRYVFANSTFH